MPRRLPGRAIQAGTITVTQLETSVANTVQTGGGPKITNVQITDNSWAVLDDTAVDTAGGYVLITGTNFVSGALVYFNQTAANSVAFVSATTLRVTVPALTAGTYIVYVINPDGGTAIRVPGVTASANPAWQTGSNLGEQYDGIAISLSLVATDATSYTLTSGSLPPGLTLNTSTGAITGTVTGVTVDTVYTFTVRATDAQLQDSPRTFTVTITVSDPYFKLTTLLLSGSAVSANTVVRDSSTNNFNLTVYGDARASNFTPYGTGWSVYFDGTGDYLSLADNEAWTLGSSDFSLEVWIYPTVIPADKYPGVIGHRSSYTVSNGWCISINIASSISFSYSTSGDGSATQTGIFVQITATELLAKWSHIVVTRSGSQFRMFINGQLRGTLTSSGTIFNSTTPVVIGRLESSDDNYFTGYISNVRLVKGSIPAEYQTSSTTVNANIFTPPIQTVAAVSNTQLLTCHVNRFLDASANNFAITRNGDAKIVSFNPFNITNTGVNGSMYFDGTGDYVGLADSAVLDAAGDFTLECWFYPTSNPTDAGIVVMNNGGGSATAGAAIRYSNAQFGFEVSGGNINSGTSVLYQWHHLALVRNGSGSNNVKAYLQGNLIGQVSSTNTQLPPQGMVIGRYYSGVDNFYAQGYIADVRYVVGTAVYTANFTPTTSRLTAVANTQVLTCQFYQPHNNHTFLDSSSNQFVITRSGNATQGTFSPFSQSGWGNYFDGSSSINVATATTFAAANEDFTIECWVYRTSIANQMICCWNNNPTFDYFYLTSSGSISLNANNTYTIDSGNLSWQTNTWYHIAISRVSGVVKIFLGGNQVGSNISNSNSFGTTANIRIADWFASTPRYYFSGYISNFRFVKGIGVYTGNFNVPTSPLALTQSAGTNIQAIAGSQTKLLTCQGNRFTDASGTATSVTVQAGSPSVQAFSPFAPAATYSAVTHGGSAYFDGSGDYLTLSTNPLLNVGTSNFSVEFWGYFTTASATNRCIFSSSTNGLALVRSTFFFVSQYGVAEYASSSTLPLNSWLHIVVTRSGTALRVFINGKLEAYNASVSNNFSNTNNVQICADGTNGQLNDGYIANFRLIKGSIPTEYQTSSTTTGTQIFTPPTAPVTTTNDNSLLLNFTDAAILDSTGRNVLETVADARLTSVVTKFTGGSMYFDGTGDYVKITPNYLTGIGTADFTIEGWWYFLDFTTRTVYFQRFWSFGTGLANHVTLNIDNSGYPVYRNNDSPLITASAALSLSTWTHVALVRYNGTTRIYINGTDRGNTATNNDLSSRATNIFYIGSESDGAGGYFYGYVSDFRITRYARYTANFTAPTAPARLK